MVEPRSPIDVCITIDAEFDINYSLERPETHSPIGYPSMQRLVGGRSQGLGFILDTLNSLDLPATFFVEMLCTHFFGPEEIQSMVSEIRHVGKHDIQLHAHPCWLYFKDPDWRRQIKRIVKNDSWAGRGVEALPMLQEAVSLFEKAVGHRPMAFRTGNLQIDRDVHHALAELAIPVSSSVGLGLASPTNPELQRWLLPTRVLGVLEVPVAAYREPALRGFRSKCLTITGTTWPVMKLMLDWAYREQYGPIVILTHASEFSSYDATNGTYHINHLNQRRLQQLTAYLASRRDQFDTTTFGQAAAAWQRRPPLAERAVFVAPRLAGLNRAIEKTLMDFLH